MSLVQSYQTFKKDLILIHFKLFHKIETEGTRHNLFCKATLIPKLHKVPTKKENFKPLYLMNINAKILNEIFPNQIQEHNKMIMPNDHQDSNKYSQQ